MPITYEVFGSYWLLNSDVRVGLRTVWYFSPNNTDQYFSMEIVRDTLIETDEEESGMRVENLDYNRVNME